MKKELSQMVKKELSIEEIERQALLELPDRKLMSLLQGGGQPPEPPPPPVPPPVPLLVPLIP